MYRAALVFGLREYLSHGLQHPQTLVPNNELHAAQAAYSKPPEGIDPSVYVFLNALGSTRNLTEAVLIYAIAIKTAAFLYSPPRFRRR